MAKVRVLKETRTTIRKVAQELEDFVCATMGPYGQNIALHNDTGAPVITKDGVSVARVYEAELPEENLIADILKQAAEKTNSEAGDGTTTSIAIASSIIKQGEKLINLDQDVNTIRREITKATEDILKYLEKERVIFSDKSDDEIESILYKIALISTNGDEGMSKLIAKGVAKAGELGLVTATKGDLEYELTQTSGMKIENAGVVKHDFIQGLPDKKMTLKNCYILLTTHELESAGVIREIEKNVLDEIIKKNASLLVIPKKSGKGFLANMINFNAKGTIKNAVVRPPYYGSVGRDVMDDIAVMTGARVIDEASGDRFINVKLEHLGFAKEVEVDSYCTMVFDPQPNKPKLEERIKLLESKAKSLDGKKDADNTMKRLAALTGNFYTIRVPSSSEIEDKEKMDRIDDALNACRGALKEGYLPGGGTALLNAKKILNQDNICHKIFGDILSYPFKRILINSGKSPEIIERDLENEENKYAYDVRNDMYGLPLEIGIIDSYRVVTSSLRNGVSVGLMLLTTTGILADKPVENASPYQWDM